MKFKQISPIDNIAELILDISNIKLNISGGWGYDSNCPVIVNDLDIPNEQFFNLFASLRANIEMNMTLDENDRYAGINLTLKEQKNIKNYTVVTFKISAIKESKYAQFIKEYKDGYGKKDFDLAAHFNNRKKHTLNIESDYWFILQAQSL